METLKKEQRSTNDQITSTMGTMEGARRATGIVPMVEGKAHSGRCNLGGLSSMGV